jgi:hypothetical protein
MLLRSYILGTMIGLIGSYAGFLAYAAGYALHTSL